MLLFMVGNNSSVVQRAESVRHYKILQINPLYQQVSQLSGQIRSYCKKLMASRTNCIVLKNCCQQQDESYRIENLSSAAGQIVS